MVNEMQSTTLTLEMYGKPYTVTLPDLVSIGEGAINKNVCEQSGLYAFYAAGLADARNRRDAAAQALKDKKALVEIEYRKVADESGIKTTEAKIAALVELHGEVVKWKEKCLLLDGNVSKIDAIVRSLEHRKDMLVTLGANMRTDVEKGNLSGINKRV